MYCISVPVLQVCPDVFPSSEKARHPRFESFYSGWVGAPERGVHPGGGAGQWILRWRLPGTLEKSH